MYKNTRVLHHCKNYNNLKIYRNPCIKSISNTVNLKAETNNVCNIYNTFSSQNYTPINNNNDELPPRNKTIC